MVNLAQKLKIQKKWEKRLYDHIRVVVCKKPLQKTPNIRKMRAFLKRYGKRLQDNIRVVVCKKTSPEKPNIRKKKIAKIGHDAKAIAFAKWSVWLKN